MPHKQTAPQVSVVVPIYKVEKYLRQCVDSILAQTLADIEIILVDDGSPDACPAIVDEYAAQDPRIIAIHQPNGGYGKAVNTGVARASAPYIGIIESDDWVEPDMYGVLLKEAQRHDADIAKCWFYDFLDTPNKSHTKPFPQQQPPPEGVAFTITACPRLLYYHPSIWTCLYKADFLRQHGIRMQEMAGSGWTDNPFQVQTLCLAQKIVFINKPYYHWRRVNEREADALNDYRIPFERCDFIHAWLKQQGIQDASILANLYARELNYVLIVSHMRRIADKSDCCRRMKALCQRMKPEILKQAPLNRKTRKAYRLCSLSPALFLFTRRLSMK
ncbi:MAG: glycosyltransferase [Akkermansia sp.]|nr:glycosyltransferase [Akkermansia sp.]